MPQGVEAVLPGGGVAACSPAFGVFQYGDDAGLDQGGFPRRVVEVVPLDGLALLCGHQQAVGPRLAVPGFRPRLRRARVVPRQGHRNRGEQFCVLPDGQRHAGRQGDVADLLPLGQGEARLGGDQSDLPPDVDDPFGEVDVVQLVIGRKVRGPVVGGGCRPGRPLDQQPQDGQDAVPPALFGRGPGPGAGG